MHTYTYDTPRAGCEKQECTKKFPLPQGGLSLVMVTQQVMDQAGVHMVELSMCRHTQRGPLIDHNHKSNTGYGSGGGAHGRTEYV